MTFLLTVAVSLVYFYFTKPPRIVVVSKDLYISSQLHARDIRGLSNLFRTIVDVRPDGESIFQPSSRDMRARSEERHIDFYYIPVAHEGASESAVTELADVLATAPKATLLYCRTGRRAVRLLALAEASRAGGPGIESILEMVRDAGFSPADLKADIEARIALRGRKSLEK